MTTTTSPDIQMTSLGSVMLLTPMTPAATFWMDENLQTDQWQWVSGSLAVDHRYADGIIERMKNDGLEIK